MKNSLIDLIPQLTPHQRLRKRDKESKTQEELTLRNPNDIVSILDGYAITSDFQGSNPLIQHSYKQFEGQGMYHMRPTTHISNGINPDV